MPELSLKSINRKIITLVILASAMTGAIVYYGVSRLGKVGEIARSEVAQITESSPKISALGRLEPVTEVISLSAPLDLDGDRVAKIMFKEGATVRAGEVIAILDSRDRLKDQVLQAEKQVAVAQAKLAQIQAGAKFGDIQAQKANIEKIQAQFQGEQRGQQQAIARIEAQWYGDKIAQGATIKKLAAELKNAQSEANRYQQLYKEGAISGSVIDNKQLILETTKQQLNEANAILNRINTTASKQLAEAKAELNRIQSTGNKQISEAKATFNSISEVRPVDVQLAQREVESAIASLKFAKTDLEAAYIKAPMTGQIIKIHTHPGEKINSNGIADFAQTEQMLAIAEVYQSDIHKVKLGQKALVTSQSFTGELKGTIVQVAMQVKRQNVFSNQPGENLDSRVVEVKIRLNSEDSKLVAGLTNLQVQTIIEL